MRHGFETSTCVQRVFFWFAQNTVKQLRSLSIWTPPSTTLADGPLWLKQPPANWPQQIPPQPNYLPEEKREITLSVQLTSHLSFPLVVTQVTTDWGVSLHGSFALSTTVKTIPTKALSLLACLLKNYLKSTDIATSWVKCSLWVEKENWVHLALFYL